MSVKALGARFETGGQNIDTSNLSSLAVDSEDEPFGIILAFLPRRFHFGEGAEGIRGTCVSTLSNKSGDNHNVANQHDTDFIPLESQIRKGCLERLHLVDKVT